MSATEGKTTQRKSVGTAMGTAGKARVAEPEEKVPEDRALGQGAGCKADEMLERKHCPV